MPPQSLQVACRASGDAPLLVAAARQKARCTDFFCCCALFLALVATGGLAVFGYRNGNIEALERFAYGRDTLGRVCGQDPDVKDFPLTYYTLPANHSYVTDWSSKELLDLRSVCTKLCPSATDSNREGPVKSREAGLCPHDMYQPAPSNCTWYGGNTTQIGMYCIDFDVLSGSKSWESYIVDIKASATVLAIVPLIALTFGFAFLAFVNRCGGPCIVLGLILAILIPAGIGTVLYLQAVSGHTISKGQGHIHPETQKEVAYGFWGFSALLVLLTCCFVKTVRGIIAVLKAATHFLSDNPAQMLLPVLVGIGQLIVIALWLVVFAVVASIGAEEQPPNLCLEQKSFGCVKWDSKTRYYGTIFLLFMLYWLLNLLHALSHFATAFAVGSWYFTAANPMTGRKGSEGDTCCHFGRSTRPVLYGMRYHIGSLAFGAFAVSLAKMGKLLTWWAQKRDSALSAGNPVIVIVRRVELCLAECFERFIEFVSENAYVEIALVGSGFCEAARRSLAISMMRPGLFAMVGRVAAAIRLLGIAFVIAATVSVTGTILLWFPPAGLQAPAVPMLVAALSAIVVGEVMMHPFTAAARACLHCYCLDAEQARANGTNETATHFTPQAMISLAEMHDVSAAQGYARQ